MNRRSDRLVENTLARELELLERDLREFASNQPTSGRSGVLSYPVATGNEWDHEVTVGSDAGGTNTVTYEVIFNSDGTQPFPIENLFWSLYCNGTGPTNQVTIQWDTSLRWSDANSRQVVVWEAGKRDTSYLGSQTQYRWTVSVSVTKQVTLRFKAVVSGTSRGTLSVQRIV